MLIMGSNLEEHLVSKVIQSICPQISRLAKKWNPLSMVFA